MPIISIIVPVYNSEKYIEKTLYSLTNQTLQDIEIICINDGSSDHSLKILQQHSVKDPRIKVFSQTNLGQASARNLGLKKATGKYLMFCDSDDWYERNMCERLYNIIEQNSIDIVQCRSFLEREFKSPTRKNFENYVNQKETGRYYISILVEELIKPIIIPRSIIGIKALTMRKWECLKWHIKHDCDYNAALIIMINCVKKYMK